MRSLIESIFITERKLKLDLCELKYFLYRIYSSRPSFHVFKLKNDYSENTFAISVVQISFRGLGPRVVAVGQSNEDTETELLTETSET